MKRRLLVIGIVLVVIVAAAAALVDLTGLDHFLWAPSSAPPTANSAAERKVLAVLGEMERSGRTFLSVDERTGRMLRLLTEAVNAKSVVEVGTSTGYSGLWFCLALQRTSGRLTTFEIDAGRAAMAREHFRQAGVDQIVTVVEGDAHVTLVQVKAPIDVVFLDADKEGYPDYLRRLLPLLRPGGLILADNVNMSPEYLRAITTSPDLETMFDGRMSITLKKR